MTLLIMLYGANTFGEAKGTESRTSAGSGERYTDSVIQDAVADAKTTYQVTLYGVIDLDLTYSRNNKDPSVSTVTSGNWNGSRLGLRGNEDLGDGLKAVFQLESGFGINNGQLEQGGRLFGRQAYVGLAGRLGAVTLGRQYAASDAVAGIVDIISSGSFLSAYKSQFYWRLDRLDNALLYSSPKMGGLQAVLGYAFGENDGAAGSSTRTAGVLYSAGPLTAGVSFESWATSSFSGSAREYDFWNFAASYDLGAAALVAGYSADDANQDISSTIAVKSETFALGAKLTAGAAGKIISLFQVIKPEHGAAMNITSLSYTHALSKRTALYAQTAVANSPAADVYGRRSEFTFGIHHQFNALVGEK